MVRIRLATESDRRALSELIPASARGLSRGYYSDAQTESAIQHVFGTDSALISDGTYFLAEEEEEDEGRLRLRLVGCGGWSRRRTLYGGDQMKAGKNEDPLLDPSTEPARIRAFFVHPDCARRGIGTQILQACLDAARAAGFHRVTLASTLPGVPFYSALGFAEKERLEVPMPGGMILPVIRMERDIGFPAGEGSGEREGHG
ncbi:MAG TPA: GNAT family N-acetyltransferase [Thermoanaerobaculia bacterium]